MRLCIGIMIIITGKKGNRMSYFPFFREIEEEKCLVIGGGKVFTGVMGVLFDKLGRKHFYMPLLSVIVACTLVIYLMEFMPKSAWLPVLYVAGIFMLGAILSLSAALMSSFQDYIPTGAEVRLFLRIVPFPPSLVRVFRKASGAVCRCPSLRNTKAGTQVPQRSTPHGRF